jgi:signal transduction histidine kinase
MRLVDFIADHMESILVEWEAFAATRTPAAEDMSLLELRDHAAHILEAITKDLANAQDAHSQWEKSLGRALVPPDAPETAAQTHAVLRSRSGFDINQLVAEYRALRASVLRLWDEANAGEARDLEEVIRFNEAIDQALTESVAFYSAEVERSRNLLLGMLGHDMRGPLNTIQLTGSYLARLGAGEEVSSAAQRLIVSGARVCVLLDDLVDFNRIRLRLGLRITPAPVDLGKAVASELEQLRFANPDNPIELEIEGDVCGCWDEHRLQQVLCNLVLNAVKYGTPRATIHVRITGLEDSIIFEVQNSGAMAEGSDVERLFDPLRRGAHAEARDEGLGLGLYIAREIAIAHGGYISVYPHAAATVFSVNLPRETAAAA